MANSRQLGTNPDAEEIRLARIRRKDRLDAANEYIGFAVNKLTGLGSVVGGAVDLFNPSLIPQIHHPEYLLGAGLALLGGKSVLKLVKAMVTALND